MDVLLGAALIHQAARRFAWGGFRPEPGGLSRWGFHFSDGSASSFALLLRQPYLTLAFAPALGFQALKSGSRDARCP